MNVSPFAEGRLPSALGSAKRVVASSEQADHNGHLNVRFHFDLLCDAIGDDIDARGFDVRYREVERLSLFTVEHAINYRGEVLVGDEVLVTAELDGRVGKALYYTATIFNNTRQRVASSMTAVLLHVSLETRRSVDFPRPVEEALDAQLGL